MQRQTRSTDVTAADVLDWGIYPICRHATIMTVHLALLCSGHHCSCTWIVVGVVQERLDVRLKKWIENVNDTVLLSQLLGTIKCDPHTLQMHSTYFDDNAFLFIFQDTITFAARHTTNIQQLGTIYHIVIMATGHTHALHVNLEAQSTFIFPQGRGDTMTTHPWHRCGVLRR